MKNRGILSLIVGFAVFVAGLVLLEHSGAGIFVLIAGIGGMIFGSVSLMAASGSIKARFFDNGRHYASNQASEKVPLQEESENVWEKIEQKQD